MKQIICDMCKKFAPSREYYKLSSDLLNIQNINYGEIIGFQGHNNVFEYDICEKCIKEIRNFIIEKITENMNINDGIIAKGYVGIDQDIKPGDAVYINSDGKVYKCKDEE